MERQCLFYFFLCKRLPLWATRGPREGNTFFCLLFFQPLFSLDRRCFDTKLFLATFVFKDLLPVRWKRAREGNKKENFSVCFSSQRPPASCSLWGNCCNNVWVCSTHNAHYQSRYSTLFLWIMWQHVLFQLQATLSRLHSLNCRLLHCVQHGSLLWRQHQHGIWTLEYYWALTWYWV